MKIGLLVCSVLVSAGLHAQLADFRHRNFYRADSLADANYGASVADLVALSGKLTHSLVYEEEKFRAIYKWVCSNIEFDYETFRLNRDKRNKYDTPEALQAWNKKLTPLIFRNLILEKKTICTGYAWLVQQLAQYSGIRCIIVDGYGRNASANVRNSGKPNHSWNAVKLNNKWYLCDATWSSGTYDVDWKTFIKKYDDSFFLADPKVFVRNHYPVDVQWTLLEAGGLNPEVRTPNLTYQLTLNEFLNGPLIYSSAYRYNITQLYPATFDIEISKNKAVNFRFVSDQVMKQVELSVHAPKDVHTFHPEFDKDTEGVYSLAHTFTEKGRHIVHVLLNNSYAFTYAVTVK